MEKIDQEIVKHLVNLDPVYFTHNIYSYDGYLFVVNVEEVHKRFPIPVKLKNGKLRWHLTNRQIKILWEEFGRPQHLKSIQTSAIKASLP